MVNTTMFNHQYAAIAVAVLLVPQAILAACRVSSLKCCRADHAYVAVGIYGAAATTRVC